jgi:hypothetical protein
MNHGREHPGVRSYQQFIFKIREKMRDVEVVPPDGLRSLSDPRGKYATRCFEMAWFYVITHKNVEGIHYVVGEALVGGLGLHAWVELPNDVVFDGVMQRFYSRAAYYDRQHVKVYYRYTGAAAVEIHSALHRNLGDEATWAWHLHLGLPWGDASAPLLIDSDLAVRRLAKKGLGPGKVRSSRRRKTT